MTLKRNIKFLNKKESAFLFVIITPIFIILAIPAIVVFMFRAIFNVITPIKEEEQTNRRKPDF